MLLCHKRPARSKQNTPQYTRAGKQFLGTVLDIEVDQSALKDVFTDCGDVTVVFQSEDGDLTTRIVHSDKEIDRIEADLTIGGRESV